MKLLNAGPLIDAGSGAHLNLINVGALIRSFTVIPGNIRSNVKFTENVHILEPIHF
jgi:hypothetical protein